MHSAAAAKNNRRGSCRQRPRPARCRAGAPARPWPPATRSVVPQHHRCVHRCSGERVHEETRRGALRVLGAVSQAASPRRATRCARISLSSVIGHDLLDILVVLNHFKRPTGKTDVNADADPSQALVDAQHRRRDPGRRPTRNFNPSGQKRILGLARRRHDHSEIKARESALKKRTDLRRQQQ